MLPIANSTAKSNTSVNRYGDRKRIHNKVIVKFMSKNVTTINSSPPLIQLRTILVSECERDGVLCRVHFVGNAATVALFR